MKKILKIIAFQIGVDVLGFPKIHEYNLIYKGFCTYLHEKYHKSIKFN